MDPLAPLIANLQADGRPRVWSLVITVFGDSVQPRGGTVSTAHLQRLLGRIGIEAGALRTALSRLARDGWVSSQRDGRLSYYTLTPEGTAQFSDATNLIYAPDRRQTPQQWRIALEQQPDPLVPSLNGLALRPADTGAVLPPADFALHGTLETLAPQMRAHLLAPGLLSALNKLHDDLRSLAHNQAMPPLDAAAARVLLVHRWRRLVLRSPELPTPLLPKNWQGQSPRAAVAQAWHALLPAAEIWWSGQSDADLPPMPAASPALARRFV